jgi:hypothetical protein
MVPSPSNLGDEDVRKQVQDEIIHGHHQHQPVSLPGFNDGAHRTLETIVGDISIPLVTIRNVKFNLSFTGLDYYGPPEEGQMAMGIPQEEYRKLCDGLDAQCYPRSEAGFVWVRVIMENDSCSAMLLRVKEVEVGDEGERHVEFHDDSIEIPQLFEGGDFQANTDYSLEFAVFKVSATNNIMCLTYHSGYYGEI